MLEKVRLLLTSFENHRKDAKSDKSILAWKHFNKSGYNFQQHADLLWLNKLGRGEKTFENTREFWILKLKASYPDEPNKKSNEID